MTYEVVPDWARWELPEYGLLPRGNWHGEVQRAMSSTLRAAAKRLGRDALVTEEVAVRWRQDHPKVGVDPDVAWVEPAPPEGLRVKSIRTWVKGHVVPRMALEVVSPTNPYKDYEIAPDRYGDLGVEELWVFDPDLEGPRAAGGPFRLQVWHRKARGLERVYVGDGPVRTEVFGAWLVLTESRRMLRLADDPFGAALWPTEAEQERAEKERERAAREAAEGELAALRRELAALRGGAPRAKKRARKA